MRWYAFEFVVPQIRSLQGSFLKSILRNISQKYYPKITMPFHFRPKNDCPVDVDANILERMDAHHDKPKGITTRKCQQTWVSARPWTESLSYRPSNCREVIQNARRHNKEMYPRKGSCGEGQQTRKRNKEDIPKLACPQRRMKWLMLSDKTF
ncbi:hypothetical protein GQX74_000232 [Glossina fuscipes]|nr:hypothetical protein GQX74_000232 [Glossina fuscipes]